MVKILIADDTPELRNQLVWAAKKLENIEIDEADNHEEAKTKIDNSNYDVVITDLKFESSEEEGIEVLKKAKEKDIYTQVIVITSYPTPQLGIEAMKLGAFDYIERTAVGTDVLDMVYRKIKLALEFREAKLKK